MLRNKAVKDRDGALNKITLFFEKERSKIVTYLKDVLIIMCTKLLEL